MTDQSALPLIELVKQVLSNQHTLLLAAARNAQGVPGDGDVIAMSMSNQAKTIVMLGKLENMRKTNTPLEAIKLIVDAVQIRLAQSPHSASLEHGLKIEAFDRIMALFPGN